MEHVLAKLMGWQSVALTHNGSHKACVDKIQRQSRQRRTDNFFPWKIYGDKVRCLNVICVCWHGWRAKELAYRCGIVDRTFVCLQVSQTYVPSNNPTLAASVVPTNSPLKALYGTLLPQKHSLTAIYILCRPIDLAKSCAKQQCYYTFF